MRSAQRFETVRIKYINLNSIKSVLFTKAESSTSQKGTKITPKVDSGADGILMPFKISKSLFPKATKETKNNSAISKT